MIKQLKNFLALKEVSGNNLDDPNTTVKHREIILLKPFLKKIYDKWYSQIIDKLKNTPKGTVLEIGSGGGYFKEVYPNVVSSDILALNFCDMVVDATTLPFDKESLSAITMVNVFHHIPNVEKFLSDALYTLKVGGKIIMIEPSNCLYSRLIYQNLHHEPFDPQQKDWKFESVGPLSSSNQAVPWIVFERDLKLFKEKFPQFQDITISYHSPISYLLSGGVSMKSLCPLWATDLCLKLDKAISSSYFSMFQTIEIKKV